MSRLLKLYDRALREGFNVNYVKREDDDGVCRPVVNVNKDAVRWCWRFYTPENECDMIESALNEAGKLYGVTSAPKLNESKI